MNILPKLSKLLLALVFLFVAVSCNSSAKKNAEIIGVYHMSNGDPQGGATLFVLENHKFVTLFFGGAMMGDWQVDGDKVYFDPITPSQGFRIHGRHNPKLGDSIRIFFSGFDSRGAAIGFDQDVTSSSKPLVTKIFNDDPNCVAFPTVHKFKTMPKTILFAAEQGDEAEDAKALTRSVYSFNNTEKYNDFIADYSKEGGKNESFQADVKEGKLYFDGKLVEKKPLPTTGEDITGVRALLNTAVSVDKVYYNAYYNQSEQDLAKDTLNYKYNAKKGAYINFPNYTEGEEDKPENDQSFNSMTVVYVFNALPLLNKTSAGASFEAKPLFMAKCKENN